MDKTSPVNKKQGPAGVSRKAYSIFGGIINLTQSSNSNGGGGGNEAKSTTAASTGLPRSPGGNVCISGTSQDLQGSSNVYTVTVTNSQSPRSSSGTSPKTFVNFPNNAATRKKKGVQSSSAISSVNNSTGLSSNNNSTGPIGPAPRTISILTALNELAVSDERRPNPGSSSSTALKSPQNTRRSSSSSGGDNLISKSNPTHSSFQHPSRRHSTTPKAHGLSDTTNLRFTSPSASGVYQSTSSSTGATRGSYHAVLGANSLGYNEPQQQQQLRNAIPYSSSANVNTLPSKLRTGNKSLGGHKETLTRKGAGKQRDRSKSRTPDWIWKIFQLTKLGKLEELQESLQGLDPTLIRHLTDARGNNLLHSTVRAGHVRILKWLVSVLGSQCTEAALTDHNQAGRTVILTALKKGQLQCLQWLVNHTKCGEKALVPNEGERSLLHFASIFGNVNTVRFLCAQLIDKGFSVDVRDASGMTPLHDAAKSGNITVCHELILAGADPLSQTELGWRPSDLAIRHRHMEVCSYFMVAEAAGSLGNQLHSLLLAFNHLRQEHEELRSHFRETLRVAKSLSKERNDVIKHFNSNWSQEGDGGALLLLGGATNGTRFSDMEHKLVLAEQCMKKISQNVDDSPKDSFWNGEDHAQLSNISSQDFLHRRLATLQLRLERNQSVGATLSGSSDEDPSMIQNSSSSDDDGSSSDLDVERVTSITAGSTNAMRISAPPPPQQPPTSSSSSSSALTQSSSTTSPMPTLHYSEKNRTRLKAAPWLLPPNDVFLSQLSPFVDSSCSPDSGTPILGKGLPTLDLLHGAPTSPSVMSPILVASTSPSSSTSAVAPTTEAAGKNEKSLVQLDAATSAERHGSHGGKRDSTSLEISVLEVIEPSSHASSPSPSKKKGEDGVEQFQVSASASSRSSSPPRPWLDLTVHHHYENQKTRGMLRSLPKSGVMRTSHEIRGEEGNSGVGGGGLVKGVPGQRMMSALSPTSAARDVRGGEVSTASAIGTAAAGTACSTSTVEKRENEGQMLPAKGGNQAPDLICGMQYRIHSRRKSQPLSLIDRHHREENYYCETSSREKMIMERGQDHYETIVVCEDDSQRKSSNSVDELSRLDKSLKLEKVSGSDQQQRKDDESRSQKTESENGPSFSSSLAIQSRAPGDCGDKESSSNGNGCGGGGNGARSFALKTRTPSPKSYVTKLTVIPVDPTETCFLTLKPRVFPPDDHHDHEEDSHLPGDNHDDIGLSQIPCDSVSSSNTPVMPRFSSSGSVLFPLRKPEWNSSELLSFTTPDSSLAGRMSPTPSETSRTESALAPPPSYISHASQNSELSKTESQRGQVVEGENMSSTYGGDGGSPPQALEYINKDNGSEPGPFVHQPIIASTSEQSRPNSGDNGNATSSSTNISSNPNETNKNPHSSSSSSLSPKSGGDYTSFAKKDDDDDEDVHDSSDNVESRKKPPVSRIFAKQRFQAAPPVLRSSSSSTGGIHKSLQHHRHHHHHHQRLPKGRHSKPWYEIEGSDDEGSLLRVASTRSNHHHPHSSSESSSPTDNNPESSSQNESEGNNEEGNISENEKECSEHRDETHSTETIPKASDQRNQEDTTGGQGKVSQQHHRYYRFSPENKEDDSDERPSFL